MQDRRSKIIAHLFQSALSKLATENDKKILDLSDRLKIKKEESEQEKAKKELLETFKNQSEDLKEMDQLSQKREEKFLSSVQKDRGVWMHRFSDVSKDDEGFFISISDNPAGSKMKVGDELADLAMNSTPYWKIISIKDRRINLAPINSNPFKTGVGAGGAKITKHDIDVHSGEYEKKYVAKVNEALAKGNPDIDTIKYILLGTVPVQFGPNGAQGGWYSSTDSYSNRGKGKPAKEVMMLDAQKIKDHGIPVPKKALDGSMDPSDWDHWIGGNGSDRHYFPKDISKYVDFHKRMTDAGKYRYDEDSLKDLERKFSPSALDAKYEQMMADVISLSKEEWEKKYKYYNQSIKEVVQLYDRAKKSQDALREKGSHFHSEGEDDSLGSIMKNVFSPERRIANANVTKLIELCKEDESNVKYLHDIINLGGAKDYLANEAIIEFFNLIDDIDGLKNAALKLKEQDNIKRCLSFLYRHGEEQFALNNLAKQKNQLETLNWVLGTMRSKFEESPERKETLGRNNKLLKFVKDNDVVGQMKAGIVDSPVINGHYANEMAYIILKSFGPVTLWEDGDENLVKQLKEFSQ